MQSPVIVARHLSKWYGPRAGVRDVSFEVAAGEVMGLLGPNGSGKTTILRILTGYVRPSSGTVTVAGLDVVGDALAVRQRVGYVPEDIPLYENMRVREFLGFMARLKGLRRRAVRDGLDRVCERLHLDEVLSLRIAKLSKGFRQRVAVAQALLNDPEILILDEPTNGLDPHQIIETRSLIRALAGNRTIVISSHILGEVEKIADRVAILLAGRVLAVRDLASADAERRFLLRVRGAVAEVRACLEGVSGVKTVTIESGANGGVPTYSVEGATGHPLAEELAAAVVGGGFGLEEIGEASVDLESLFLKLTRSREDTPR